MISKTVRFLPQRHSEEITLRDSFGHEQVVMIPLVSRKDGVLVKSQPEEQIAQIVQEMELREKLVLEHAQERGHIQAQGDNQADGFKEGEYRGCCPE